MSHLKRSDALVFFFDDEGELRCRNFLMGREFVGEPALVAVLALLGKWRTPAQLQSVFSGYSPHSVRRTLADLKTRTLAVEKNSGQARRESILAAWKPWGVDARLFHFGTKRAHQQEPIRDEVAYRSKLLSGGPEPAQIKRYPKARRHVLPDPPGERLRAEFPSVLLRRRTHRSFGPGPMALQDLSTLLALTWRVTGRLSWPGLPPRPLKTSPSGGARHSLEAYVFCRRVTGVSPGLYHYRPDIHELELLHEGASTRLWPRFCGHQDWVARASALFIVTSVLPRMMWRYRFSRAYRTLLLETGHFGQTFCLAATWLGLAPFTTAALDDELIEAHLGIDGASESVLYAMGVGPRALGENQAARLAKSAARL